MGRVRRGMEKHSADYISLEEFMNMEFEDSAMPELIYGSIYNMAPTPPKWTHQKAVTAVGHIFESYFMGRTCDFIHGPLDVFMGEHYVIPDMMVICDKRMIQEDEKCHGAPDLIIEVLSPSTAFKDKTAKLNLYRQFGVKEYWIVNPLRHGEISIEIFHFFVGDDENEEIYSYCAGDGIARSRLFDGLAVDVSRLSAYVFGWSE
jgi:Uma2 family endonuclease